MPPFHPRFALMLLLCFALKASFAQLADTPRVFGEGVISNGDFTFNTTFTPDGRTVFFSRSTINWGYIAIFMSKQEQGVWGKAVPVAFTGTYRDTDPVVSADGKRLYFSSDRPLSGGQYTDYNYHLFYVPLQDGEPGSAAVPVDVPLLPGMKVSYPSFTAGGDLYFTSSDTATRDGDIYVSTFRDGVYHTPERLPFNDPKIIDFDPVVARDGSFVIFSSIGRKGGLGSVDLWVSFHSGDTWTTPVNLGPHVNTALNEGAPGLSPDNKKLYFQANRQKTPRPVYKDGKMTADALDAVFHSTANGLPHIYEIDISDLISLRQDK